MESFFTDQRWTSEAEPELGVGIVTETSKGRVKISFPSSGESRLYATGSAPLRRVRFKPGDTIVDKKDRKLLVESVREHKNLLIYIGKGRTVSEADLGEVTVQHGVDDRLLMGDVEPPNLYSLRRQTLQYDYNRHISATRGFVGGRIDLIPHQLYIAREVSSRYAPRVLLSDEVGLGKTIEACLILHRLLLQGRVSRVLILVPESLVHQWFVELMRRFNMWFHIFDEERCLAIEETAPDGNPFLDDQLVICSTAFLASSQKRTEQAIAAKWDMLVVDEAHHLEWSVEQASPEYQVVELLSKVAEGLLLLTATPEQLGLQSHFARLRLLDPDRYSDYETFKNEPIDHSKTADLVEKLSLDKPLQANDRKFLESLVGKERMEELKGVIGSASKDEPGKEKDSAGKGDGDREENATEKKHLIQDLLDQHGPGRIIFRNTRAAMKGFPKRKVHPVPLEEKQGYQSDPDRVFQEQQIDWLLNFMQEIEPAKALLICQTKEKVLALENILSNRTSLKVGVFHEDLTLVQRDRNAAWFAEPTGAGLLLCSEIGSEGRNFQFAHHLILWDLPLHPELLEQRIGRLDRIGQTEDINIHVPYLKGSPEEALVRWYHEGLNAFEKNLQSGNKISNLFRGRLHDLADTYPSPDAQAKLKALIEETKDYHKELQATLASGRDRLMEMNSFRPDIARQLVEKISEEDQNPVLERFMNALFDHYLLEVEDLDPRTFLINTSPINAPAFPSIPPEGMTITFDRSRALVREDVTFLSWDHPLVTGGIDHVLSSGMGSASFGILRGPGSPAILMELIFVLETVGEGRERAARFLPSTPVRVVVDHNGADVTDLYSVEFLEQQVRPGPIEDLLDQELFAETIIPRMVSAANEIAEHRGAIEVSRGFTKMKLTLNHEIGRLKTLQKKNSHIRPEEIHTAEKERDLLSELIKDAGIRLDSIQLIQKGDLDEL